MKRAVRGLREALPQGRTLPPEAWLVRHRGMQRVLWLLSAALFAFALAQGRSFGHAFLDAALPALFAVAARHDGWPRRVSAVIVSLGLMTGCAVGVHLSGGAIEAHFLFFIAIPMLGLYEDWLPFLVAVAWVVVHHTTVGLLAPSSVYVHEAARAEPLTWALVHAGFVLAACVTTIVSWRINETIRANEARAHARARESEARLNDVLDNAPIGEALVGLDGRFERVNRALCEFLRREQDELLGRPFAAIVGAEGAVALGALVGGRSETWEGELPCRVPTPAVAFARAALRLRRDAGGRPVDVIVQLVDITSRKQAEEERDRMELELRLAQKLEAVGQLAAGMAHEINTPIQFVGDTLHFLDDACADMLELLAAHDAVVREAEAAALLGELTGGVRATERRIDLDYLRERIPSALSRGFDGIDRVAGIVRAMGEFARPPSAEHAPVDLNEAIRTTLVVATNAYADVADVETDLGHLPPVVCDAGDINQVLLSIVVNAGHAVGNAVEGSSARGTIRITSRREDGWVRVSVSDTGAGIPPEVADRVFDPFFTTKDVGRGTGQGLAIARTIVTERRRGSITFETAAGRGTTFHVRLPASADERLVAAEAG